MIKVIDKWVIDTDGKQYICGQLATRTLKDGTTEKYIKEPFYPSTLTNAVRAISRRLRMEAIKNMDGDIKAAIEAIHAADTRLIKALGVLDDIEVVGKR